MNHTALKLIIMLTIMSISPSIDVLCSHKIPFSSAVNNSNQKIGNTKGSTPKLVPATPQTNGKAKGSRATTDSSTANESSQSTSSKKGSTAKLTQGSKSTKKSGNNKKIAAAGVASHLSSNSSGGSGSGSGSDSGSSSSPSTPVSNAVITPDKPLDFDKTTADIGTKNVDAASTATATPTIADSGVNSSTKDEINPEFPINTTAVLHKKLQYSADLHPDGLDQNPDVKEIIKPLTPIPSSKVPLVSKAPIYGKDYLTA